MRYWTFLWAFWSGIAGVSAQTANVNVFSMNEVHFYVYLDGKLQNADPQKNIRITDVPEGNCIVKVEFYNEGIAAMQTHSALVAKKETAFMIQLGENGSASFNEYSSVPINQVNIQAGVAQVSYSNQGVTKNPNAKVTENSGAFVGTRQNGVLTGADIEARRMGQTRGGSGNGNTDAGNNSETTSNQPQEKPCEDGRKEEITEVKTFKTKIDENGGQKILCERWITTKTTVCENGMELVGSEEVKKTSTTAFTCLPKGDAEFLPVYKGIEAAANRLDEAKKQSEGKCLTPEQIMMIADLLADEAAKKDYAVFAKPFCAHPTEYPLESLLPAKQPDVVVTNNSTTTTENNNNSVANTTTENNTTNPVTEDPKTKGKAKKPKKEKKEKKPKQ